MRYSAGIALCAGFALLAGCGTSEETERPAVSPPAQPQAVQFETRTDTVRAVGGAASSADAASSLQDQIRFMVQVGAFRDPQYASAVQTRVRARFHLPVLNDYDARLKLYQIRIGFFVTREQAAHFRDRMKRDFPQDYRDAWVVQMKR